MVGAPRFELGTSCAQGRWPPFRKSFLYNPQHENKRVRFWNGCGWMWPEVLAHAWSPHTFPHSEDNANVLRGVIPLKVVTGFVPRPKGPGLYARTGTTDVKLSREMERRPR